MDQTSSCPQGASGAWQWRGLPQEGLMEGNASGKQVGGLGPSTSHRLYVPTLFREMKGLRTSVWSDPMALLYGSRPEPGGKWRETQRKTGGWKNERRSTAYHPLLDQKESSSPLRGAEPPTCFIALGPPNKSTWQLKNGGVGRSPCPRSNC